MSLHERAAIYIDLDAIHDNMRALYKRMRPGTRMIAVIKADGYGHGALEIARETVDEDFIFGFAVATIEEAMELRQGGIEKPILILGFTFPDSYPDIVRYGLRPAVFRRDQAKALSDEAVLQGKEVFFHLAVDTGMSRIGVRCDDSSLEDVRYMMTLPNVVSEGIFTHFARADEPVAKTTERQLGLFRDYIFLCEDEGVKFRYKHCSNSAGMILYPEANMDLVRAGITMYGMWPSDDVPLRRSEIKSALELKSHIVYIKNVAPGAEISYGGTYVALNTRRIATVPVGYADGFPRSLSNKGYVLIRKKYAPILGRICMDQFMVDVTDIPEAEEGDTVVLLGHDGENFISAEELGRLSGRFNYEFTCDLGKRIPRIFLKKGEVISERYPF